MGPPKGNTTSLTRQWKEWQNIPEEEINLIEKEMKNEINDVEQRRNKYKRNQEGKRWAGKWNAT